MAAQFPANVPTFTTKADFVTDILADHVNRLQEEVVSFSQVIGTGVGAADPRTPAAGGSGATLHTRLQYVETTKSPTTHTHGVLPYAVNFGTVYRTDYDGGLYWQGRRTSDNAAQPLFFNWYGGAAVYISDVVTHSLEVQGRSYFSDGLELGQPGGTPYIDFHSSSNPYAAPDYDGRIILAGPDEFQALGAAFVVVDNYLEGRSLGTGNWGTYPLRATSTGGSGNTGVAFHIPGVAAAIWKFFSGDQRFSAHDSAGVGYIGINAASFNVFSSRRWKENIEDLTYGLDTVLALQPRSFTVKEARTDEHSDSVLPIYVDARRVGLIAEETVGFVPEVVSIDGEGIPSSIDYAALVPVLIKAVQEQQVQIETMQAELAAMRA